MGLNRVFTQRVFHMKMTQEEIDKLINENKRFQIVLKGYDLTGVNLAGANLINADVT